MATEVKTDLVVEAKPKGFARLRDEAGRFVAAAKKSTDEQKRGFAESQQAVKGFRKGLEDAGENLGKLGKRARDIRELAKQFDDLNKKLERMEGAMRRADQARGAFFQGFMQGAIPDVATFLQRGPGVFRQAAGQMMGTAARNLAAIPFGGVGSLVQAVQAIPGIGGMAAMPLQQALQMGGQAIQFQQTQFRQLPMLGGFGLAQQMGAARARAAGSVTNRQIQAASERARQEAMGPMGMVEQGRVNARLEQTMQAYARRRMAGVAVGARPWESEAEVRERQAMGYRRALMGSRTEEVALGIARESVMREREARGRQAAEAEGQRLRSQRNRQAAQAAGRVRAGFFGGIRRAGRELGAMAAPEAQQFAAQLAQVSGRLDPRAIAPTAMAAQTVFGVGAGVSGQFLRAGRMGGLAGMGAGAQGLTDAIADGMRMGLEGSDLTRFMEDMAAGISQFEMTGIPINPKSIASMGRAVGVLGLGSIRGRRVGAGLFGAGQRIAQEGPRTGLDLMLLQEMGFRGGGLEQMFQAMMRLEEEGLGGKAAQRVMGRLVRAGGEGAGGILTLQRGLRQMGVQVGLREAELLSKQVTGQPLSERERERVAEVQQQMEQQRKGMPTTPEEIQGLAKQMVNNFGPALKRQAGLTNQAIAVGKQMIPTLQNLQESTATIAKTFTEQTAPTLAEFTQVIKEISADLREFVGGVREGGIEAALLEMLRQ